MIDIDFKHSADKYNRKEGNMKIPRAMVIVGLLAAVLLFNTASAQELTIPEVPRDKVICFALYTVQNNVLKLTAQLYPLK